MGDISAEPSMEEILSSIKRIIAEEGEPPARSRRPTRPGATPIPGASDGDADRSEVLELNTPAPPPAATPKTIAAPQAAAAPRPAPEPMRAHEPAPAAAQTPPVSPTTPPAEPILSRETAAASRGALDSLSRLVTRPEPGSDGTLEGLVRDMLRPMLRDWLDAQLPGMVEQMVQREIARITGQEG